MTVGQITDVFYQVFVLAMKLAGPLLIVAMLVGVVIAILQAATQIHEQTLSFVPKIVVLGIMLVLTGNTILSGLQGLLLDVFRMIAGG